MKLKSMFLVLMLSVGGMASATMEGRNCSTGNGYYVSSIRFLENGKTLCHFGDADFSRGRWSEQGDYLGVVCGTAQLFFQIVEMGSAIRELETNAVWPCQIGE